MTRSTPRKLALRAQTLRTLTSEALSVVAGGAANGFIMKDSIIVRTSGIIANPTDETR